MWFDSFSDVWRVVLVGGCSYVVLVAGARVFGKRTLAKLNAFDLVVTVALGSVLATVLLSSDVAFVEGVVAMALLFTVQWTVAQVSARVPGARSVIVSTPVVLVWNGEMSTGRMRSQRITAEEVRQAVRRTGSGGMEDVAAVVLESDGQLSVITHSSFGSGTALIGVEGAPES